MKLLTKLEPILTIRQLDRLSNILDNAGQVVLGVAVLSPLITGVDNRKMSVLLLGLVTVVFCWMFSIWLSKKGEGI